MYSKITNEDNVDTKLNNEKLYVFQNTTGDNDDTMINYMISKISYPRQIK